MRGRGIEPKNSTWDQFTVECLSDSQAEITEGDREEEATRYNSSKSKEEVRGRRTSQEMEEKLA